MQTWIAWLRGINVGGHHTLPMRSLVDLLGGLGADRVRTYIQSGNVVFRARTGSGSPASATAEKFAGRISDVILKEFGFSPRVLLLDLPQLERVASANPFPEAAAAPNTLHVAFLASKPTPNLAALAALRDPSEQFQIAGRAFYLHAPQGIGRSKLAAGFEKYLAVEATVRNWRTVQKVLEMAREAAGATDYSSTG